MNNETETNFGWWTDKPERKHKGANIAARYVPVVEQSDAVWMRSALVVALVLAFGWALKQLAGW